MTGTRGQEVPLDPQSGNRNGKVISLGYTVLTLRVANHLLRLQSIISHIVLVCNYVCVYLGVCVYTCKETKG